MKKQFQRITGWKGGLNQYLNPTAIPSDEATVLFDQEYHKLGVLSPRYGFEPMTDEVTTSTIVGIFQSEINGELYTIVIDDSGRISSYNTTTGSFTVLESGIQMETGRKWNFATFNSMPILMSDGVNRPRLFDGASVRKVGEESYPIIVDDIISSVSGTTTYTYRIKVSWYDRAAQFESDASNASNAITTSSTIDIDLSSLVSAVPSRYTHFRVYKTYGNGQEYYLLAETPLASTSLRVELTDHEMSKVTPVDNSPMPAMPYLVTSMGHIFAAGDHPYTIGTATFTNANTEVSGAGTAWNKSMIGKFIIRDGDSVKYIIYDVDTSEQTINIEPPFLGTTGSGTYKIMSGPGQIQACRKSILGTPMCEEWPGDQIISIRYGGKHDVKGLGDVGLPMAFMEDRTFLLHGTNMYDFQPEIMNTVQAGTCAHLSIASDGKGGIYFLSGLNKAVYFYDYERDKCSEISLPISPYIDTLDSALFDDAFSVYANGRYYLWVEDGKVCLIFDSDLQCWLPMKSIKASTAGVLKDGTEEIVVIGTTGGKLYKLTDKHTDGIDGVSFATSGNVDSTTGTIITTDQTYTPDELINLPIYCYGQRRYITDNDASTITIDEAWDTNPPDDSTYYIGVINFKRRTGWISSPVPLRAWRVRVHQRPSTGNLRVNFYGDYDDDTVEYSLNLDLSEPVASIKIPMRASAIAIELEAQTPNLDFDIYAIDVEVGQIDRQVVQQPQEQEPQRGRQPQRR